MAADPAAGARRRSRRDRGPAHRADRRPGRPRGAGERRAATPGRGLRRAADRADQDDHDRDPLDPATDFGPVISAEARDRILGYIDSGKAEGATLAYGGGRPAGPLFERGFWGRADDLHRRQQRHDDRPRGDLRPSPGRDPQSGHRRGDPHRQRHRIRAVR
ncbi:MAG TPA: aldehyde dehydrogenase family protein [Streptosporangiaceae bacterium]|nr:aldehyde dehydrogenase family protein [Streptosporangiaceae bacterium]